MIVNRSFAVHRLAQIQAVAGRSAPQDDLVDALMDEDWDPDKYDAAMAAAFNDDYYEAVGGTWAA